MKKEYEKTNLHNSRYYVFIKLPEVLSQSNIYTVVDITFLLNIREEAYKKYIYTVVDIMFY